MLLDPQVGIMVQGITGREARGMVEDMLAYGSRLIAGVTPGKGGQEVQGIPVYDTVAQLMAQHRPGISVIGIGHLSALIAALAFGILFVILRQLGKTETVATVTIYLGVVMTPLTFIPALYFWRWPTSEEFLVLITIGLDGGEIHFCLAAALKWGAAPVVSPIDYMRLIWDVPIAYLVFDEIPDAFTWVGSVIVFGSATYIAIRVHDPNDCSTE